MLGIITGLRAEARIVEGGDALVVSAGGHQARIREAIDEMKQAGITRLVSFGIAGALNPALRSGDLVFATDILDVKGNRIAASSIPALPDALIGTVLGVDQPLLHRKEKERIFWQTGAMAVDMESHLVAQSGLPFIAIRAIADRADQDLPNAVLQGLDKNGKARPEKILAALCRDPSQLWGLIQAGLASRKALRALFRCRGFLLGPDAG